MNNEQYLQDGDSWILAEEIPDIDFQFSHIWLSSFVDDIEKTIGTHYRKVLSIYDKGYNLKFYYGEKDSERVSEVILKKIVEEKFGGKINEAIKKHADALLEITERITPEYLENLTSEQLADFYRQLDEVHTAFYTWCWLPNAVDMFHAHFTEHLKKLLASHALTQEEVNIALVALSFSDEKSFIQEEHESLLRLALFKKNNPEDSASFEEMLKKHHEAFFYLKHLWIGKDGVSTLEEYRQIVEKILAEKDPQEALIDEERKWKADHALRAQFEERLQLSEEERTLFRSYAEFAFTKAYRRRIQLYWAYKMDFVFNELVKRLGVSFIETRFLLPQEVISGLKDGLSEEMKKTVHARTEHCVYYAEKGYETVVTGKECERFEQMLSKESVYDLAEFSGQVACLGKARGFVRIVNTSADMQKVQDGDILVSIATNPDILPAMKKAAAFVTEQGGITSHAAIVAREMQKPCVIGTKIATKVLKDGDEVEVDATNGIVRILKRL